MLRFNTREAQVMVYIHVWHQSYHSCYSVQPISTLDKVLKQWQIILETFTSAKLEEYEITQYVLYKCVFQKHMWQKAQPRCICELVSYVIFSAFVYTTVSLGFLFSPLHMCIIHKVAHYLHLHAVACFLQHNS